MSKSTFRFENPKESPGFLLWQTTVTWQRLIKNALEPYHYSQTQFVIMAALLWFEEQEQHLIQSSIVNQTKLDKMTVSKAIKELEKEGLIKKNEYEKDTRAKKITLTIKGKKIIKKLIPIVEEIDHNFFNVIKKQEQRSLIRYLNSLSEKN